MSKTKHSTFDEVESVVRACSVAMFGPSPALPSSLDRLRRRSAPAAAACRTRGRPSPAPSPELLSFIDFLGPRVSGTLLLCQVPIAVVGTHPRGAASLREADVLDWANERVNQLAGRIANRLNPRGISIQIGLPATVSGSSGGSTADKAAFTRVYDAGSVGVYLQARVHDGSPGTEDQRVSQYLSEGAILLF